MSQTDSNVVIEFDELPDEVRGGTSTPSTTTPSTTPPSGSRSTSTSSTSTSKSTPAPVSRKVESAGAGAGEGGGDSDSESEDDVDAASEAEATDAESEMDGGVEDSDSEGDEADGDEDGEGEEEDAAEPTEAQLREEEQMRKNMKNAGLSRAAEAALELDEDPDDDELDSDYEEDFRKFDAGVKSNFIEKHHPELKQFGFEEIQAMTTVVRDEDGMVVDPFHTSVPVVTRHERARVVGLRAKQLANGSEPYVEVPDHIISPDQIAEMEFAAKKIPFIIKRPFPGGRSEYWKLSDLEILEL